MKKIVALFSIASLAAIALLCFLPKAIDVLLSNARAESPYITANANEGLPLGGIPRDGLTCKLSDGREFIFRKGVWVVKLSAEQQEIQRQEELHRTTQVQFSKMWQEQGMTRFGIWSNETRCEDIRIVLWPATNLTFAFLHQPTNPEYTNGVWVIRFQP